MQKFSGGTGCSGPVAARLAISLAQRQLADEAGVHLWIRSFNVINSVGAVSLRASLNCDGFADAHSAHSHFDRHSFVGLAWRPPREAICCEIYQTGRANLPGSVAERQLFASFSRMLPELLRFSSSAHLLNLIPEEVKRIHRSQTVAVESADPKEAPSSLWSGWMDAPARDDDDDDNAGIMGEGFNDADLSALGL
jgi:TATA-box binding protein (TBP) (component of TFIID and TFIIIB)